MDARQIEQLRQFVAHPDDPVSAARVYLADKLRRYEEPLVCLAMEPLPLLPIRTPADIG